MRKLADDVRPKSEPAHPDQRPEISLLDLFSDDRLSIVALEKGGSDSQGPGQVNLYIPHTYLFGAERKTR